MLHNTRRRTQPWKTGLPVDFVPVESFPGIPGLGWLMRKRREWFGEYALLGRYVPHPDPRQERLFFGLLRECVASGSVTEERLHEEMRRNHLRHDAIQVMERAENLPR